MRALTAIYPGSFDPVTLGHLDIIERAAKIFPRVVVAVMHNGHSGKQGLLSPEERAGLIREATAHLDTVEVIVDNGFTRDLCARYAPSVLVKGARSMRDFEYEEEIAAANRTFDIDTLILPARAETSQISSTVVREFLRYGADISKWVPECVEKRLSAKYGRK